MKYRIPYLVVSICIAVFSFLQPCYSSPNIERPSAFKSKQAATPFLIEGIVKAKTGSGKAWFKKQLLPKREFEDLDSLEVGENGQFFFSFPNLEPGYYRLQYWDDRIRSGLIIFISQNTEKKIKVIFDTTSIINNGERALLSKVEITGSPDNYLLQEYADIRKRYYTDSILPLEKLLRVYVTENRSLEEIDSTTNILNYYKRMLLIKLEHHVLNKMKTSIAVFQIMDGWDKNNVEFIEKVMNRFRQDKASSFILPYMEEKYNKLLSLNFINRKAIPFTLKNQDGKEINLEDYLGKKLIVIDFWASWCKPCIEDMIGWRDNYSKIESNDIVIISISTDKRNAEWLRGLDRFKFQWVQLIDVDGISSIAKKYGVDKLPTNFLIGKNGIIIKKDITIREFLK